MCVMNLFPTNPPLSADEFNSALERLAQEAKDGLSQTREMHRQLLLVRAGVLAQDG
jgi:hypothetical protein